MDAAVAIAGVVLGAIAGAVPTFFATRSNLRLEFTHAYDRVLRDARLIHYQRLFHLSECVPRDRLSSASRLLSEASGAP